MAGRHRLEPPPRVRPKFGRMLAAAGAALVTVVALLGGLGLLPGGQAPASSVTSLSGAGDGAGSGSDDADAGSAVRGSRAAQHSHPRALPRDSGHGKRVVFDISGQRVWLVGPDGQVRSTYLASGSLTDNLKPGHYRVYSRSRWAVGIDDSGVMQYFVRFTHGKNAAIGFHSIPTKNGKPLQTRAQLGQPESHGCIRQWLPDAIRLWNFAPVGTRVVVTA